MKIARNGRMSICVAFCILAVLTSCAKPAKPSNETPAKLKISVTFNALKEIAQTVGGEYVEISTLIPDGMEPHDFEPKAQDMVALNGADVFVYNGFGLETWVPKAVEAAQNKALIVVDSSEGAQPIKLEGAEAAEHGGTDPHLWLSLSGAKIQARNIAKGFAAADPAHATVFAKNADDFIARLDDLYAEYSGKMKNAPSRIIVTGHAAFGYLCRDFMLEQKSVEDVFASGEPTAKQLAELVKFVRAKKIKTVFVEEMVSPAVTRTLASEVGAKVKTIYTMENAEEGKSYLERMRDNLETISNSLSER